MKRIGWRLVQGLVALLVLSVATFGLAGMTSGGPLDALRLDPSVSPETLAVLRAQLDVDRPLAQRYLRWLGGVLVGDFGVSTAHRQPVATLVVPRARRTVGLALLGLVTSWSIAMAVGAWCGGRVGSRVDRAVQAGVASLQAVPELVSALALLSLAVLVRSLPVGGMTSIGHAEMSAGARLVDLGRHAFLPVVALTLASLPPLVLHVRAAVHEAHAQTYVASSRMLGIGRWRWRLGYLLPAAAHPLVALFGLSFAGLVSGTLLVEVIFAWPGLGPLMLEAVQARDLHVVAAVTLLTGFFLLLGNLLADLGLLWLDPRLGDHGSHRGGGG